MTDAFISYRRKPSAALAQLIQEKLKNRHGLDAYVDTTRTDGSRVTFPERLMGAIESSRCFICLLGEGTLDSEWVMKEVERAHQLKKFCIPVFQESYTPPTIPSPAVDYLLTYDGVHIFDLKNVLINESVAQIAALIPPRPRRLHWLVVFVLMVLAVAVGIFAVLSAQNQPPALPLTTSITPAALAAVTTAAPSATEPPTETDAPTHTSTTTQRLSETPRPTSTQRPTQAPTATSRLSETPRPTSTQRPTQAPTATSRPSDTPRPTSTPRPTHIPTTTDRPTEIPAATATRTHIPALHLTEQVRSTGIEVVSPSARRPSLPRQPFEDYFTTSGGLRVGIPSGFTPMEFSPEVVVFNNAVTEEYIAVWTGDAYREFLGTASNPDTVQEALTLFGDNLVLLDSPRSIGIGDSYGVELKVLIDGEIEAGWVFLDTPDGLMTVLFYDEDDPLNEDTTRSGYGVIGSATQD